MYLQHFKLEMSPFDQLPDPDFLYLTEQHKEALDRMQFALAIKDSFSIITGDVGSGKTTLVRKLLSDLSEEFTPAFITHTRLNDVELLQMILVELGLKPYRMGKSQLLTELQRVVDSEVNDGRRVVVVVDEAQNLSPQLLEELRLLTCMDTEKSKSINIVLVGQPQLARTLASPDLEQLNQRCRLRFHLNALSESETPAYIRHRLSIAGGNTDEIFDKRALESIHKHTRGVPRLVNTLCDTSMIMAFVSKRELVSIESIDDAVNELAWRQSVEPVDESDSDELGAKYTGLLKLTEGGVSRGEYLLNLPSYVIGRSEDCSIVIRNRYLSRHHALLSHDSLGWTITDLNSTNGIVVNGRNVRVARLRIGDVIEIGAHELRLIFDTFGDRTLVEQKNTELFNELPELTTS